MRLDRARADGLRLRRSLTACCRVTATLLRSIVSSTWTACGSIFVPSTAPPSDPFIKPELLLRMLIMDYCSGIRSERRFCEEVHHNLAYLILAEAHRQRGVQKAGDLHPSANRAVEEYLATLDDAAFGAATPIEDDIDRDRDARRRNSIPTSLAAPKDFCR